MPHFAEYYSATLRQKRGFCCTTFGKMGVLPNIIRLGPHGPFFISRKESGVILIAEKIYQVIVRERGSVCAQVTVKADFSQQAIAFAAEKLGHETRRCVIDDRPFLWTGYEYEARRVEPIITEIGGKKWNVVSV